MKWGRLPRGEKRNKYGADEWASYYESVTGRRPGYSPARRKSRRSGVFRITAVLVILTVLMVARQYPHPVGDQVRDNLRHMLTAEWDFGPLINKSVLLAAQLVNWDNPVMPPSPGVDGDTKPVAGSDLTKAELYVPVSGKVVEEFGWVQSSVDGMERYHAGIDISAPPGASVAAAMDGQVERISRDKELGQYILINHGEGTYTLYGGVDDVAVVEGQTVRAGQEIAVVGEGEVPGGGLHFELRENGKLVDPLTRLQVKGN
ncbi:murein hydrolase activator EnvC family protein [Desulfoscipio geothermicus]|uniref:Peptidase family M23 n=1 Tax=Desulfoscipio geothermicus DSM 3669 TaxID=1121426 RepID=A0A1I6DS14_9FIRM|nr:M23 family metallopeptidase [Desulfoscipio geothermicus]SFR08239.1 Peptidase family M23 [Desulfoscipio geothermicus DSM 3669]